MPKTKEETEVVFLRVKKSRYNYLADKAVANKKNKYNFIATEVNGLIEKDFESSQRRKDK